MKLVRNVSGNRSEYGSEENNNAARQGTHYQQGNRHPKEYRKKGIDRNANPLINCAYDGNKQRDDQHRYKHFCIEPPKASGHQDNAGSTKETPNKTHDRRAKLQEMNAAITDQQANDQQNNIKYHHAPPKL